MPKVKSLSAFYTTPLGVCRVDYLCQHLVGLAFVSSREELQGESGDRSEFSDMVHAQLLGYIGGERRSFDIDIDLTMLTPFTRTVLEALRRIPYGQVRSYGEVAEAIGRPRAARAVGRACASNPIALVVPCHRVVAKGGALTGFAWGVGLKAQLLETERLARGIEGGEVVVPEQEA